MKWLLRKLFRCWGPRRRQVGLVQIDDSWPVLVELGRWNQSDLVRFISECEAVQVNGQTAMLIRQIVDSTAVCGLSQGQAGSIGTTLVGLGLRLGWQLAEQRRERLELAEEVQKS